MLSDLVNGHEWENSGHFPRVTLCDFAVRALGQKAHNYTVQCVLMINLFNEKVFIVLWFWYIFMLFVTAYNFIRWCCDVIRFNPRIQVVRNYLKLALPPNTSLPSDREVHAFVSHKLQMDGVFLLRLVQSNAGDTIAANLTYAMWKRFQEKLNDEKDHQPSPPYDKLSDDNANDDLNEYV
jgi:hypothetical protein